jgi:hypothetical protein
MYLKCCIFADCKKNNMKTNSKSSTSAKVDVKATETTTTESTKKLSAFGQGMIKYAGTVQIVDMRAVMR